MTTEQTIDRAALEDLRTSDARSLLGDWLTGIDRVDQQLRTGITVADVGCGPGVSTVDLALAYPESTFVGFDHHSDCIALARTRAQEAGLTDRVRFDLARPAWFGGGPYDLVTTFASLSHLGDPLAAAVHLRDQLADDGAWIIVEPRAGTTISRSLALFRRGGHAPLSGEHVIRRVVTDAGFSQIRRPVVKPFGLVYLVRP